MVWESGCGVIVMLTPLSENGVRQCHHYWPDEGSNLYHVYEVLGLGAPTQGLGKKHVFLVVINNTTSCSVGLRHPQVGLLTHLTLEGYRCCTAHEGPMPYLLHR